MFILFSTSYSSKAAAGIDCQLIKPLHRGSVPFSCAIEQPFQTPLKPNEAVVGAEEQTLLDRQAFVHSIGLNRSDEIEAVLWIVAVYFPEVVAGR